MRLTDMKNSSDSLVGLVYKEQMDYINATFNDTTLYYKRSDLDWFVREEHLHYYVCWDLCGKPNEHEPDRVLMEVVIKNDATNIRTFDKFKITTDDNEKFLEVVTSTRYEPIRPGNANHLDDNFWISMIHARPRYKAMRFFYHYIQEPTDELHEFMVSHAPYLLFQVIPPERHTQQLYYNAVKKEPKVLYSITTIPQCIQYINKQLCLYAVTRNGSVLGAVPPIFRTYDLCLIAVKNNSDAFPEVPYKLRSLDMCRLVIFNKKNKNILRCVPYEYFDALNGCDEVKQFVEQLVNKYWWSLRFFTDNCRTYELCCAAIEKDCRAIQYVPENLTARVMAHWHNKTKERISIRKEKKKQLQL